MSCRVTFVLARTDAAILDPGFDCEQCNPCDLTACHVVFVFLGGFVINRYPATQGSTGSTSCANCSCPVSSPRPRHPCPRSPDRSWPSSPTGPTNNRFI